MMRRHCRAHTAELDALRTLADGRGDTIAALTAKAAGLQRDLDRAGQAALALEARAADAEARAHKAYAQVLDLQVELADARDGSDVAKLRHRTEAAEKRAQGAEDQNAKYRQEIWDLEARLLAGTPHKRAKGAPDYKLEVAR